MLNCEAFFQEAQQLDLHFFAGVPDSLLSSFSAWLMEHNPQEHVITANEGNAAAMAAGYYMATGKIPVVYMQNSGIGNIVNPAASLLHREVYQIPVLFLVGWRGEPGIHDEPQHVFQGRATIPMLEGMEIEPEILSTDWIQAKQQLNQAVEKMKKTKESHAFIIHKGTFETYPLKEKGCMDYPLTRERALEIITEQMPEDSLIVSTTGKMSRELFEIREKRGQGHEHDFLTVGSMGHASSIALGVARSCKKPVYCLDGDGAFLMHMGALAVIGQYNNKNLKHILINNGCHESVGGQPTAGFSIKAEQIAKACGYPHTCTCITEEELRQAIKRAGNKDGLEFIQVMVNAQSRSDLGRPTIPALKNKENFMNYIVRR